MPKRDFDGIPGTYVFDARTCLDGYHLNMFCKSLDKPENREAFRADPAGYLDGFPMTAEQRRTVEDRNWLAMLHAGGNVYYMYKLAAFDRITMQHIGSSMTGMTVDEFREMMQRGGMRADMTRPGAEDA